MKNLVRVSFWHCFAFLLSGVKEMFGTGFFTFSLYALSFSLVSKVCHVFPGLKSDFDGYTVANRVEIFPPCPVNASKSLHENWKRISVNGHRTWLPIVPNK